jgi:hypothetical protein
MAPADGGTPDATSLDALLGSGPAEEEQQQQPS